MNATARPPADEPRIGDTVRDTDTGKIGQVMGFQGPYIQLRPIGGGVEWDAYPANLRPVSPSEALSAGVSAANARSRGQLP
ncbi:hypothetical protein [Streptomyces sp. NPDC057877]|uniref:hypothetical protein n=1 Tax=Streptomyces sp. NPDC057877 TaxID=3346269 RepID=UPI00367BE20D